MPVNANATISKLGFNSRILQGLTMEIYGINFEHKHKNQEKPARRGAEQYRDSHRRPGVVGSELLSDLGNRGIRKRWGGILETRHWRSRNPADIGRNMNHEKSFRKRIPLHRRASTQSLAHKKERVVLTYTHNVCSCNT